MPISTATDASCPWSLVPLIGDAEHLNSTSPVRNRGKLNAQQNYKMKKSSKISKLPTELLTMIFQYLSNECPILYDQRSLIRCVVDLGWVRVTHVSRRWRSICLNLPRLWTQVSLESPQWAAVLLERSMELPISLNVPSYLAVQGRVVLRGILTQPNKLQHLTAFVDDDRGTYELLNSLTDVSASRLESIVLKMPQPYSFADPYPEWTARLGTLLSKGAPRLRRVETTYLSLPWSASILTGLTTLAITTSKSQRTLGTLSDLLDALERMPQLERLELSTRIPSSGDVLPSRVVELRELKSLDMRARCRQCETFLRHVAFPPSATVNLNCMGFRARMDRDSVINMLSSLHSAKLRDLKSFYPLPSPSSGLPLFKTLDIFKFSMPDYHYVVGLEPLFEEHSDIEADATTWWITLDIDESLLEGVISSLPLTSLQSLTLDTGVSNGVMNTLSGIDSLTTVSLSEDSAASFLNYLYRVDPALQDDVSLSSDSTCFSAMTRLELECVSYGPDTFDMDFSWGVDLDFGGDFTEERFLHFLNIRSWFMRPIYEISFRECTNVTPEKLQALVAAVPHVDWDGHR